MSGTERPNAALAGRLRGEVVSLIPFIPNTTNWFDVTRDGRRFLFTRAVGSAMERPEELVLVQNFFEELRTKVQPK